MSVYATSDQYRAVAEYMAVENRAYNRGKIWSRDDENTLLALFDDGRGLLNLCIQLGRNPAGILERLKMHYRVMFESATNDWLKTNSTITAANPSTITAANPTIIPDPWAINPYNTISNTASTQKESTTMTKPLEHKAFLFGNEITKQTEDQLIMYIKRAQDEISSYNNIPENNYTKLRIANLKDAIDAAVKELNNRGDQA